MRSLPAAIEDALVVPPGTDKHGSRALRDALERGEGISVLDLATPLFTVDISDMTANATGMSAWARQQGVLLAPHGKTTMAPALWRWQLDLGAWAITVANEFQLRVAHATGIPRVLVANELISPSVTEWLAATLSDAFEVICWVDSLEGVHRLDAGLRAAGATHPLAVCVEAGSTGGRSGARSDADVAGLCDAVRAAPALTLVGLSGFEGAVPGGTEGARALLHRLAGLFIDSSSRFETPHPLLSAGGSAFFDDVVDILAPAVADVEGSRLVLRSGAYLTHDDGVYRENSPSFRGTGPHLRPAMRIWASVLSVPEAERALLDVGKRDVSYDAGLPRPVAVWRDGRRLEDLDIEVVALADQHAFVDGAGLRVGDVVELSPSHPCTVFDKWRTVLVTAPPAPPTVLGAIPTTF